MNKTRLIVVRGFSGSGKSTQLELFIKYCLSKKMKVRGVKYADKPVGLLIEDIKLFVFGKIVPKNGRWQGGDGIYTAFKTGEGSQCDNARNFIKGLHDQGIDVVVEGYFFTHLAYDKLDIPTEEIVQYAHLFWYEKYETIVERLGGRTGENKMGLKTAKFGDHDVDVMRKYYARSRFFSRLWCWKVETTKISDLGMWFLKCYKIEDPNYPKFCEQQFKYLKTSVEVEQEQKKSSGSTKVVHEDSKTSHNEKIGNLSVEKNDEISKTGDLEPTQTNIFQIIGGGEKYGF